MEKYLKNLTDIINRSLLQDIDPGDGVLAESIHYALSVPGKRLRPVLFLAMVEAGKLDPEDYLEIAAAIEYIHTYSLIHDDLPAMDDDDLRRGVPTVHKKFNEAIALLAGDTLLTMAFEKIAGAPLPAETIVNILKILTFSIGPEGMAGGQALDLIFNGEKSLIYEIHKKKTAELIKGALLSAAEIIDMDSSDKQVLSRAGLSIGVAFQMADDLLDIKGDEKIVGKKLHKDHDNQSPNSVNFFGEQHVRSQIDKLYQEALGLLKKINLSYPPLLNLMKLMVYRSR